MNAMPNDVDARDVISFLRFAREVESALVQVNLSIDLLEQNLQVLEKDVFRPEPVEGKPSESDIPFWFGACGALAGAVAGFGFEYSLEFGTYYGLELVAFWVAEFVCTLIGFFAGMLIGGMIGKGVDSARKASAKRKRRLEYQRAMQNYQTEKSQHLNELAALQKVYREKLSELLQTRQVLLEIRECMYSTGIVYDSYQTLPALCQLLQYFESGRFSKLGEAYNQYELEVRLDKIITKMDMVLKEIEKIRENQIKLYEVAKRIESQVSSMNLTLNQCTSTLDHLKATSEMTAISSTITAATSLTIEKLLKEDLENGVKREDLRRFEKELKDLL